MFDVLFSALTSVIAVIIKNYSSEGEQNYTFFSLSALLGLLLSPKKKSISLKVEHALLAQNCAQMQIA